jgi:Domain of unknown function (DUF1918)
MAATMTAAAGRQPGGGPAGEVVRMRARVGDRLVVGEDRIGEVAVVPSADGSPPYSVGWLKGGHIATALPDQHSRVIPAEETVTGGSGAAA